MLQTLQALLVPAVIERLVLVVNHVLSAEPVATARLVPHQGRLIALELQQWPALLPTPPALKFRVTPAGLLEWCGLNDETPPDLSVQLSAANPAALFVRDARRRAAAAARGRPCRAGQRHSMAGRQPALGRRGRSRAGVRPGGGASAGAPRLIAGGRVEKPGARAVDAPAGPSRFARPQSRGLTPRAACAAHGSAGCGHEASGPPGVHRLHAAALRRR